MRGFSVLVGFAALAATTVPAGAAQSDQDAVDRLVSSIMATIQSVPADAGIGGYEGQISLTIDRAQQPCPIVQEALGKTRGMTTPEYANRALRALHASYLRCGAGVTALSGRGGLAAAFGPAFTIGAGSANYQR